MNQTLLITMGVRQFTFFLLVLLTMRELAQLAHIWRYPLHVPADS